MLTAIHHVSVRLHWRTFLKFNLKNRLSITTGRLRSSKLHKQNENINKKNDLRIKEKAEFGRMSNPPPKVRKAHKRSDEKTKRDRWKPKRVTFELPPPSHAMPCPAHRATKHQMASPPPLTSDDHFVLPDQIHFRPAAAGYTTRVKYV